MKQRKNLDLSEECIKTLTKYAIDKNTKFKLFAENILEDLSKKINSPSKK